MTSGTHARSQISDNGGVDLTGRSVAGAGATDVVAVDDFLLSQVRLTQRLLREADASLEVEGERYKQDGGGAAAVTGSFDGVIRADRGVDVSKVPLPMEGSAGLSSAARRAGASFAASQDAHGVKGGAAQYQVQRVN